MQALSHYQLRKLDQLIHAANSGRDAASKGYLFYSRSGLALVNAAFDLFECDALYDLGCDVARELGGDGEEHFPAQGAPRS